MNPYEESLLRTHQAELARETRALQLEGEGGAIPASDDEIARFGAFHPGDSRLSRWLMIFSSWRQALLRFSHDRSRGNAAPESRLPIEPAPAPAVSK